jgi:hypothetical protein
MENVDVDGKDAKLHFYQSKHLQISHSVRVLARKFKSHDEAIGAILD